MYYVWDEIITKNNIKKEDEQGLPG